MVTRLYHYQGVIRVGMIVSMEIIFQLLKVENHANSDLGKVFGR